MQFIGKVFSFYEDARLLVVIEANLPLEFFLTV
jgi:hypothetical protein